VARDQHEREKIKAKIKDIIIKKWEAQKQIHSIISEFGEITT